MPTSLLEQLTQSRSIDDLSADELIALFHQEPGILSYLPNGSFVTDPRNGDRVLFNAARARRPHDNRPADSQSLGNEDGCIICQGQTTGVVDVAELSQGQTFINKNLFPILFPFMRDELAGPTTSGPEDHDTRSLVRGLHFLQWTSTRHDQDWHNMIASDRLVVMERLAALERRLIDDSAGLLQVRGSESPVEGYVLIGKNYGRLVGGSLAHGHQQIALSSVMPRKLADNHQFQEARGETFSAYMLRENPPGLLINDYGPAVLLVPYFMRRPYDMMLLLKNSQRQYLHQLSQDELQAVADGWRDAIRIIRAVMPAIGRETAYNILTNNGPGAGLYFEFLPYTQEFGGFEQLGLLVCQADPLNVAGQIRRLLTER